MEVSTPDQCWNWKRASVDRYPVVNPHQLDGRRVKAHRYAFFLTEGYWPDEVLHSCDNTRCCNPFHLVAGSHQDNMTDMVRKERQTRGERHPDARLAESDVLSIRQRRAAGESLKDLAAEFGVSAAHLSKVCSGKKWRHL